MIGGPRPPPGGVGASSQYIFYKFAKIQRLSPTQVVVETHITERQYAPSTLKTVLGILFGGLWMRTQMEYG